MKTSRPLTQKQKLVLDYINEFIQIQGYSPALKDIGKFIGTENLSTAQYFLQQLAQKGYIKKETYKNRGITPLSRNNSVQLLGYIAAGAPIEPIESPVPISLTKEIRLDEKYPHYALRVKGSSMMDMGILDNDIVIIRHQLSADSGDVVVAITENGATLKILKKEGNSVYLEARSEGHENIFPNYLEIRGVLIGLIRNS